MTESSDTPTSPPATVTESPGGPSGPLATALKAAFDDALAGRGSLPPEAFDVLGFSGWKMRLFFNNLMRGIENPRYLEIGLYLGASFCAALAGNRLRAVGIDNWSQYNGKRIHFDRNLARFRDPEADVVVIEDDFRLIDIPSYGPFNVMFYDGAHKPQDQYDGVFRPISAMDARYILLVDDWNWTHVRDGTASALRDAGAEVEYAIELRTTFNGHLPEFYGGKSEWHNGLYGAVVSKP